MASVPKVKRAKTKTKTKIKAETEAEAVWFLTKFDADDDQVKK